MSRIEVSTLSKPPVYIFCSRKSGKGTFQRSICESRELTSEQNEDEGPTCLNGTGEECTTRVTDRVNRDDRGSKPIRTERRI